MEMQEVIPPMNKMRKGKFRIDMCFDYTEGGESILQWCQGTVTKILKEDKYKVTMEIKWDSKFVEKGQSKTREKVLKSAWNPETHKDRAWRQDLHHLEITAECA